MPFGAAVSSHPVSARATGEVAGAVLESTGPGVDLAVLAVTSGHAGALADIAGVIRTVLSPGVLLGAVVPGLVAAGTRVSAPEPAVALWGGSVGPATPVRVAGDGAVPAPPGDGYVVVLGAEAVGAGSHLVAGGLVAPTLLLDGAVFTGGAVAASLPGGPRTRLAHLPGLRALGPPQRPQGRGRVVTELDGQPALHRLTELARHGLAVADLASLGQGLHLRADGGEPVAVLGSERGGAGLVVASDVAGAASVQLLVPDPLALAAAAVDSDAPGASGALAFGTEALGRALGDATQAVLPAATLWCDAPLVLASAPAGGTWRGYGASVALFP